jgi:N-acetylneuraminic acid mutarotase
MRSLLIFLLVITFTSLHAQNEWQKLEAFGGSKRERAVSFAIGNRGYIGCGQDTAEAMNNDLWEFDPGTNSWTQKASFAGIPRRDAVGFSIGNKGYVGTGMDNALSFTGNSLNDFWEYDPAANMWTQRASFPGGGNGGVYYATGFSILNKGYICCGKVGASYYSNELWEYNPAVNSWVQRANFPGGVRYGLLSFVINGKAYVGMGADENVYTTDIWCYDPANNTWQSRASFPGSGRFSCSTFAIGARGFVAGGSDGGYKSELWEYNSLGNWWVQRADFGGGIRRSAAGFAIGNKGYMGTGKGDSGSRRDFWEYTPAPLVGVEEIEHVEMAGFYPNPMSSSCTIILPVQLQGMNKLELRLYDNTGREVQRASLDASLTIQKNDLAAGAYFCFLLHNGKMIANGKLIVQ